ncbi:hypothetical protein [Halocatena pleomorpha]|uniref:Uncharacterized protein n=1 Tax=Halocatena pleomorpha TaxID=1785090 RepID=A0A3P3R3I8_9EURY|nr:hypothetical protein [Halocatena pleomorpha]RRJ28036.1 hypothetical protein EIK79_16765 [Halocatena pleomorpha]
MTLLPDSGSECYVGSVPRVSHPRDDRPGDGVENGLFCDRWLGVGYPYSNPIGIDYPTDIPVV